MRAHAFAFALGLVACGNGDGAEPTARADVVMDTGTTTAKPGAPSRSAVATSSATSAPRPGKLCPASARVEKDAPKVTLGKLTAGSATIGEGKLETGGTWTWINVWAGWCEPCRMEMPRLLKFQGKLKDDGTPIRLTFVSLDDDDREARKVLDGSPLKESFFVGESKDRGAFLSALGTTTTSLPVQAFVDPKGSIRCIAQGAVTDDDYAEIAALVGKKG